MSTFVQTAVKGRNKIFRHCEQHQLNSIELEATRTLFDMELMEVIFSTGPAFAKHQTLLINMGWKQEIGNG